MTHPVHHHETISFSYIWWSLHGHDYAIQDDITVNPLAFSIKASIEKICAYNLQQNYFKMYVKKYSKMYYKFGHPALIRNFRITHSK